MATLRYPCPFCHDASAEPDQPGSGKEENGDNCEECSGSGVVAYDASYYGLRPIAPRLVLGKSTIRTVAPATAKLPDSVWLPDEDKE